MGRWPSPTVPRATLSPSLPPSPHIGWSKENPDENLGAGIRSLDGTLPSYQVPKMTFSFGGSWRQGRESSWLEKTRISAPGHLIPAPPPPDHSDNQVTELGPAFRAHSHLPGSVLGSVGFAVAFRGPRALWLRDSVEHDSCSTRRIRTAISMCQIPGLNKMYSSRPPSLTCETYDYVGADSSRVLDFKLERSLLFFPPSDSFFEASIHPFLLR